MCCNSYVPGCAFKSRLIYGIFTGGQNECSVRCLPGHSFPNGTTESELLCHHGVWDPVEDCDPVCEPACQNGGRCLSDNQCLCGEVTSCCKHWKMLLIGCFHMGSFQKDFRGGQCQFPATACNPSKLGYNGGYNCSGTGR